MSNNDSGVEEGSNSNESSSMSLVSSVHSESDNREQNNDLARLMEEQADGAVGGCEEEETSDECHLAIPFFKKVPICHYGNHLNYSNDQEPSYIVHNLKTKIKMFDVQNNRKMKNPYNSKRNDLNQCLQTAVLSNDIEKVQNFLNYGANPKYSDDRKRTPLHFAACKGHAKIAELLIERGANPNDQDVIGNTPLHVAACTNNIEVITILLKSGANLSAIDKSGRTPIHLAQSKLMALSHSTATQLKEAALEVIKMMQVYLQRSANNNKSYDAECDLLAMITNRLHIHQTKQEVDIDVQHLLSSLDHLTL